MTFHGLSGRRTPLASLVPRSRGLRPLVPSLLSASRRGQESARAPAMQATKKLDGA